MNVKKYQAASMYEAVQQIKNELGSDAVILQSKQTQRRRFGLLPSGTAWEVTAGADEPQAPATRPERPAQPTETVPPISFEDWREIKSALTELQWEVRKLSRQGDFARVTSFAPSLRSLYQQLLEQEVDEELVTAIVTGVSEELSPQALGNYRVVEECAARHIRRIAPCAGALRLSPKGARTVFVIGPTGVGKTTTIAKLAAYFSLIARKQVLLVTIDTYRIAALPQLKTYAEIMGLALEVAYTPAELRKIVQENQSKDLILIDTPGRGQRNEQCLAELKSFVDAVENRTVCLAVSAATRYRELVDVLDRFGAIAFDNLVVTKLDEAVLHGPVLNLVNRFKKPLSYFTVGQSVPEDIEEATASKIADLLLGRVADNASGSGLSAKKSS